MKRAGSKVPGRPSTVVVGCVLALAAALAVLTLGAVRPAFAQAAAARGIADSSLTGQSVDPVTQQTTIDEIHQLNASYVRIFVSWALAAPSTRPVTPTDPAFDMTSAYMQGVASAISDADNLGLKVIVTIYQVPPWASQSKYWSNTVYNPSVVIQDADLAYFGEFCQQFAQQFTGQVAAYECWNEPNLGQYLAPQRISGDAHFAEEHYLSMLKVFWKAIKTASPQATVVAGATAPTGVGGNTPPQVFAAWLAQHGAGNYFNVYSHHPYAPGGSRNLAPESQPTFPTTTVTLGNLSTLLKLFPGKPFWLTEYGYQTAACHSFSDQHVNQATQAAYLERAYAFVAKKYPQVKLLMWFLVKDMPAPAGKPADYGFYTGLDTTHGAHKLAWWAFAGHNRLTITAPSSIRRGASLTVKGTLACLISPAGKQLELQSHAVGKGWMNVKAVKTSSTGAWSVAGLHPKATVYYRITWSGVVNSRTVRVTVR